VLYYIVKGEFKAKQIMASSEHLCLIKSHILHESCKLYDGIPVYIVLPLCTCAVCFQHRLRSLSYSDDEKIDLMRMSVPTSRSVNSPERHGNISMSRVSPESMDGSDVIPFRDSEYEEIGDDDLMLSHPVYSDEEKRSCKSAIEKNAEPLSSESMEAGIDSALGRSVSNPSLHTDRCPLAGTDVRQVGRGLDFGYSSESHSADKLENAAAGKYGSGNSAGVGTAVESAVWDNRGPDSAGTSGIGASTMQQSGLTTDGGSVNGWTGYLTHGLLHCGPLGEETDDDFNRLNELPFDDVLSTSEVDLLSKLASDGGLRPHGRSLDSLAPLSSEKPFLVEKRVSSVEIIVDSTASSSRPSVTSQMSPESFNLQDGTTQIGGMSPRLGDRRFAAPSSCDASSEGTLSDYELSDPGAGESPSKACPRTKRVRRSFRGGISKSCSGALLKSPTKRRVENPKSEFWSDAGCAASIVDGICRQDFSGIKRSRLCRSLTDLFDVQSPTKTAAGRRRDRCDGSSLRKVPLHHVAQKKLDFPEDICSVETQSAFGYQTGSKLQQCSQQSTGDDH